jgi:hypothetical protein
LELRKVPSLISATAEATVLLWALQLTEFYVIIEGDVKVCVDAFVGSSENCPWAIAHFC